MGKIVNISNEEISIKEASLITGIKYHTFRKWIMEKGIIPYRDYEPLKMVLRSDVIAFRDSHPWKFKRVV